MAKRPVKPEWVVRVSLRIQRARIVERPSGIVELDLGVQPFTGRRWYYMPEHSFKLIATNHRRLRDQGKGDFTIEDGRNVCQVVKGMSCYCRVSKYNYLKEEWISIEILTVS